MIRCVMAAGLGLLLWVAGAVAQQVAVPVRAVEHPEYSRLVLPVPAGTAHALSRDGARAVLRLSGDLPAYDVSGVFDRMPRTRILAVTAGGTGDSRRLELSLACSCSVTVERIGTGYLAIDVRRAAAAPGEVPLGAERKMVIAEPESPDGPSVSPAQGETDEIARAQPPADDAPGQPPDPAAAPPTPNVDDSVAIAQASLLRQLARAADEGLLTLAPTADTADPLLATAAALASEYAPESPAVEPAPEPLDGVPRLVAPPEPSGSPLLSPHLSVRVPLADRAPPPPVALAGAQACVADEELDVRAWIDGDVDPASAIGARRRALVSESGQVDQLAARDLARLYVGLGFGREASMVLRHAKSGSLETRVLDDLAQLVEGRPVKQTGPVASATDCVGRVSLWRAVAGMEPFEPGTALGGTIRATLLELPPRLRRLAGQQIARHSLLAGAHESAGEILDILDRTPGSPDAGEIRQRARLHLSNGEPDRALALVFPLIEDRPSPDPRDLQITAEAVLASGGPIPPNLFSAMDAALPVLPAGAPRGRALRIARAQLAAAEGRPIAALAALRALPRPGPQALAEIRGAGRVILAGLPDEARRSDTGARAILGNLYLLDEDSQSRDLRIAYATALLSGGLPNAAAALTRDFRQLPDRETRLVHARAQLRLGAPSEALAALEGLDGVDVARLRADAHLRDGELTAAFNALDAIDPRDVQRNTMALLSGTWEELRAGSELVRTGGLAGYALEQGRAAAVSLEPGSSRSSDLAEVALARSRGLNLALADMPVRLPMRPPGAP